MSMIIGGKKYEYVRLRKCPRCELDHEITKISNEINGIEEAINALRYYGEDGTARYLQLEREEWELTDRILVDLLVRTMFDEGHLEGTEVV